MEPISIVVVGASGDLARRKIFPALFALYCQGLLPSRFHVFGFARTPLTVAQFRERIAGQLTCRYAPGESCAQRMDEFLARCDYQAGEYGSRDAFLDLAQLMVEREGARGVNRLFYLAVPSSVFVAVARGIGDAGFVRCGTAVPWSRVVIEKPFGKDRASSDALTKQLGGIFAEDQTFRIDHYLGKEVIQNLMVLRFANLIFEPIWNRHYVHHVRITWEEDLSIDGRGGYFDSYGIIRDVMQNHLLQILALVAMEPPARPQSRCVRDEKVKVLQCIPPPALEDIVLGQYTASERDGRRYPGYAEDPTVPAGSRTPTFAATVLRVHNPRWDGIPFLMRAGKGLNARMTEIRVRFRDVPASMFASRATALPPNELVIRVQPDEAIHLSVVNKVPGPGMDLAVRNLDLRYEAAFAEPIPDAYESLLLDVMRGDKGLFIRSDELAAAWDVFTPVLHAIDARQTVPHPYPFAGTGPVEADALALRYGAAWR